MSQTRLATLALATLLALPPALSEAKDEERTAFVKDAIEAISLGEPLRGELATIIPLVTPEAPGDTGVLGQPEAGLEFSEPEFASHRYDVNVKNPGDKPVLLLGGSVVLGGERDRMIRHSTLIGPGAEVEVNAWPASSVSETRKDAIPFTLGKSLAPNYLRGKADHGSSNSIVGTFISRNLEFRNEGDDRKSLAAIGASDILQQFTEEARSAIESKLAETPQRGTIVGWMIAIRGRLQAVVVWGDPSIAKANRGAYLLGATYAAAAVWIQSDKKNIKMPGRDDPDKTFAIVMKDAEKLWERLKRARLKLDKSNPEGAVGERVLIQLPDRTRARAVGVDGKLVHLEVFPHDPVASAIYGSAINLPNEEIMSDPDRIGLVELGRRAEQGRRLTYAEQRMVGRFRPGRGGSARGTGGAGANRGTGSTRGGGGGARGGGGGGRRR